MMLSLYLKELQTVFFISIKLLLGAVVDRKILMTIFICPGNLGRILGPTVVEIRKCKKKKQAKENF